MARTVAILGGGHGAQTLAADLALAGHHVRLFELPEFAPALATVFASGRVEAHGDLLRGTAQLDLVTDDLDAAISDAQVVLVAVPAFGHATYAHLLGPRVKGGQLVALLPGTLGTLEMARVWRDCGTDPDVVLAETETLPYATRALEPGSVHVYGRTTVQVGVFPATRTAWAVDLLADLLPVTPAHNVLEAGFNSLNPVLHPPGTILNAGRIERSRGDFYIYEEGMTPSVVRVIETLDAERRALAGAFGLEVPTVAQALHQAGYGPDGSTWAALNGSPSLTPIKGPASLDTRYLSEDIPFGLVPWSQIGAQVGVTTPVMDALVTLGRQLLRQPLDGRARTVDALGLAGLDAAGIVAYVTAGGWAPHLESADGPESPDHRRTAP
ncbi:MAG TPA: NAD/NADP octopine/nopaline dehydrogenase family protein [Euzebyales bacterium]|nr:NAD/NADP octopine/nopaline dehydrogenase family protein [Euzebyales bacterium]